MKFHSKHGGMWIDRTDFENILDMKVNQKKIRLNEADLIKNFVKYGYIVFENAIEEHEIDAFNSFTEQLWANRPSDIRVQTGNGEYKDISQVGERQPLVKLLDLYAKSPHGRKLSFNSKVTNFLRYIFEEDVLAFQSLTFQVGSTQACHKDGSYVVVERPLEFAASWIALEDVHKDSGELEYYPQSHRFIDKDFPGGRMHWNPSLDGHPVHDEFLSDIHRNAKNSGIQLEKFLPKKGTVFIWHPGLAHGGAQIKNDKLTRKSYVTHYCPISNKPNYFKFAPDKSTTLKDEQNNFYSSWFYNVK